MFERYREIQERRASGEPDAAGFTLIELLIVIVVLGILAATVIFALSGVTGQSAVAACNSDAKTAEVAVQAYINSPSNPGNAAPTTIGALTGTAVGGPYMTNQSNQDYTIALGGDIGLANDNVYVSPGQVTLPAAATTFKQYDLSGSANPCSTIEHT
jgi:general secretion pathway protein G